MITNIKISIPTIITFVVDFFELSLNVLCLLYAVHFWYLYIVLEGNFAEGANGVAVGLGAGADDAGGGCAALAAIGEEQSPRARSAALRGRPVEASNKSFCSAGLEGCNGCPSRRTSSTINRTLRH